MKVDRETIEIPHGVIEAIRGLPLEKNVQHCGSTFTISPFDFYAVCPHCNTRFKARSFSGLMEIEDVFDAVFEWINQTGAEEIAKNRRQAIAQDDE